jgi:hypothetical protein
VGTYQPPAGAARGRGGPALGFDTAPPDRGAGERDRVDCPVLGPLALVGMLGKKSKAFAFVVSLTGRCMRRSWTGTWRSVTRSVRLCSSTRWPGRRISGELRLGPRERAQGAVNLSRKPRREGSRSCTPRQETSPARRTQDGSERLAAYPWTPLGCSVAGGVLMSRRVSFW